MMKTTAVIVAYYPDEDVLARLVSALVPQVEHILVVDNNSEGFDFRPIAALSEKVSLVINQENLGIAAGFNQGVAFAIENGSSHVVLFDQDSLPAEDMLAKMHEVFQDAKARGIKLAALGPNYVDVKGAGQSPFVKVQGLRLVRVSGENRKFVSVDHLISSGCLVDLEALGVIGVFEEQLFIDYVDTEWCLRAKSKGYELYGVCEAYMKHDLGEQFLTILHKTIPVHSPLRHYYLMRNGVWLIRRPWVGWRWRIIDTVRLTKILIVFSVFGKPRLEHIRSMLRGIKDGLLAKF